MVKTFLKHQTQRDFGDIARMKGFFKKLRPKRVSEPDVSRGLFVHWEKRAFYKSVLSSTDVFFSIA
jgi:hypothetical protein